MAALGNVVIDGGGAAPHFDELTVVREGVFDGEEAADAGACVDDFGEVGLLDGGGALPTLLVVGGQGEMVIGCCLKCL